MEKGKLVGIIGGICFFLIILLVVFYLNSDFDQQLIDSVNAGTPADKLIPQIENETAKEKLNARKHLDSSMNDMKYWKKSDINPEDDSKLDMNFYEVQMEAITNCSELSKQFVRKQISKEQFLSQLQEYKLIINAQ